MQPEPENCAITGSSSITVHKQMLVDMKGHKPKRLGATDLCLNLD